ncbi:unnamed protein product [Pseudo-nitzschia multistriata]|uniref:ABC1 atypical kinase-like domain-containing protein n=1 Tax=Pseudo-nitzschia multistriata TaxID=183589 RepID=A0A448Z8P7_9STRA|nr:unnamed protein product [Pseudo-nitzschia multistriata]
MFHRRFLPARTAAPELLLLLLLPMLLLRGLPGCCGLAARLAVPTRLRNTIVLGGPRSPSPAPLSLPLKRHGRRSCSSSRTAPLPARAEVLFGEEEDPSGPKGILSRKAPRVVAAAASAILLLGLSACLSARISSLVSPLASSLAALGPSLLRRLPAAAPIRTRPLALALGIVLTARALALAFGAGRRRARDATSEWQRYAEHPGARGRAILAMVAKQSLWIATAAVLGGLGARARSKRLRRHAGAAFSASLLGLGPLYVKLGQIASCRKGLLGEEWIEALEDLQDRVPARKGSEALELAHSALPGGRDDFDKCFVDFDTTPLAAASLGQVHRARLRDTGEEVAIKVQRPHLKKIYDRDLALLTALARSMDKLSSLRSRGSGGAGPSWTQIFADAEAILYREIDYRDEASNAARFASDFGLGIGGTSNATTTALARNSKPMPEASSWIRTPHVYPHLSSERLLVQEYVPSIKITDGPGLDAANLTAEDRAGLADDLARAYLRQFCCNLFFSTDPHPGNLGVELVPTDGHDGTNLSTSTRPRLVMYDFGQVATLTKSQADGILEIIEAIIDTDVERSIEAFQKMEVLVEDADLDQVRQKVAENYRTGKIKANRKKLRQKGFTFRDDDNDGESGLLSANKTTAAAAESQGGYSESQVMSSFTLPAEYAFVARAISQMDGVGKSLDPDFDFISSAAPYIVEIKGTDLYLKDEATKFARSCQERLEMLRDFWTKGIQAWISTSTQNK